MTIERALRLIAGIFVVGSVGLGMAGYKYAFWFTLFVGVNLIQSGFSNWCGMMSILRRAGLGHVSGPGGARAVDSSQCRL